MTTSIHVITKDLNPSPARLRPTFGPNGLYFGVHKFVVVPGLAPKIRHLDNHGTPAGFLGSRAVNFADNLLRFDVKGLVGIAFDSRDRDPAVDIKELFA